MRERGDGWGCSDRQSAAWGLALPDEEEPELIAILLFLALGHRWPRGVPAQDREKLARAEGPLWELWLFVFYGH